MIATLTKSKIKILEIIHENPGIKISDLFKTAKISPQKGYEHINDLLKNDVIKEKILGSGTVLRLFYPNYKSELGQQLFTLIETGKKLDFLNRKKGLTGPIKQLEDNLSRISDIKTALIFGSFARDGETANSDIDILFITTQKIKKTQLDKICETCFVTSKNPVSGRILSIEDFIKLIKEEDPLYKNLIRNHIAIYNSYGFIEILDKISLG